MNNQNAIKFLTETLNFLNNNKSFYPPKDVFALAISALEKQIPKQIIHNPIGERDRDWLCPSCKNFCSPYAKYCPNCGQAVKRGLED